jgi:condensin complex subunit 3
LPQRRINGIKKQKQKNTKQKKILIDTFDQCDHMHEDMEKDQEMISPYQFRLLLADWTDPQKTVPT